MDIYTRLRTRTVLHSAWARVKSSGLSSGSENTRRAIQQFDANWLNNLESIRRRLKAEAFAFSGERGITPPKKKGGKELRPLVVAPVDSRIVRRAILDVLQGYGEASENPRHRWSGVPAVRQIMETPTSIGGIRGRGVPHGLAVINRAIDSGCTWFARSDIQNFFTRIPKPDVNEFIRQKVNNQKFSDLFERALATNLENQEELEERQLFKLFPDPQIGVAQGSALSALAGNIALRTFDSELNGRGIVCVRYIDDFILLGPSEKKVLAAFRSAQAMLKDIGMDIYELADATARKSGKVDSGNIFNGTDVLGYRVSGTSLQPCAKAQEKFIEKIDKIVSDAKHEMKLAASSRSQSHNDRFHQSMVLLHKTIWGWSQSFRHTTARHVFVQIDRRIDRRIASLRQYARELTSNGDANTSRRVMGVHLLGDTVSHPLPELNSLVSHAYTP